MINPELQPFLRWWDEKWSVMPPGAPPQARRAIINAISDEMRQPLPPHITQEERRVPHGDRTVRVCVFRNTTVRPAPALIFMHGGGFVQGSPETHDAITVGIADRVGYTVISVDYSLAPEHRFPVAVRECEAVVHWAFANAAELGIRRDAISVGGDSAGGNLAAALTLIFRGTPQALKGQLLIYPVVEFNPTRPSMIENANGPIITAAGVPSALTLYCPDPADQKSPLFAPMLAPDLAGLPTAYVAVAEHDPLRDEGRAYADRLRASGVPVELHAGTGLFHGYLRALTLSGAVRDAFGGMCDWLGRLTAAGRAAAAAGGD
ncbi:MAG TPA: alpha/beta hydrolase [Vineibacter sp.]|nr:alpha/beta hydrolase [Vineibacter sp.]